MSGLLLTEELQHQRFSTALCLLQLCLTRTTQATLAPRKRQCMHIQLIIIENLSWQESSFHSNQCCRCGNCRHWEMPIAKPLLGSHNQSHSHGGKAPAPFQSWSASACFSNLLGCRLKECKSTCTGTQADQSDDHAAVGVRPGRIPERGLKRNTECKVKKNIVPGVHPCSGTQRRWSSGEFLW